MNNRQRMRASNKMVREWLLSNGYDEIWFKPHMRRKDITFTKKGSYLSMDLWNLFDGLCFDSDYRIIALQMKTNHWAPQKPLVDFAKKYNIKILSFNVTDKLKSCKGKYKVFVRCYN